MAGGEKTQTIRPGPDASAASGRAGSNGARSAQDWQTERVVAPDADRLAIGMPGMDGEITRTGNGRDACVVTMRSSDDLILASVDIRFPLVAWAGIAHDAVVLGIVRRGVADSRWNGEELDVEDVIVLPPGSSHAAVEPDGLQYEMIVAQVERLESAAAGLELELQLQEGFLQPEAAKRIVTRYWSAESCDSDDLLLAVTSALSEERRLMTVGPRRRVSSLDVTRRVNENLEATGSWIPSSLELCRIAAVSERRLQQAFHDVYGMAPSEYLRQRALSAARELFERLGPSELRVAEVSAELGFGHPGRFAFYYRSVFGETPSETLAAHCVSR